ncbi:MAG TPA: PAS domain S-box protein [Microvirga sp.]|jgi:PAS domain S-box-containing protein|nr:PAS domain S-box protein [Microvirga sp.]
MSDHPRSAPPLEAPRAAPPPPRPAAPRAAALAPDWRPQILLLALCVVGIASLWIGIGAFLQSRSQAAVDQVRSEVRNLSIALEEQVQRTFLGIDQMMRLTVAEIKEHPAQFELAAWLARVPQNADVLLQVSLADAGGDIVASSVGNAASARVNIADREHFRVHKENAEAGLFISRPVLGRVSGRWSIQASRRIDGRDGRLAGVLVFSIDPVALGRIFANIDVGPAGAVTLIGTDGAVLARAPVVEGTFERGLDDAKAQPILKAMQVQRHGLLQLVSPFDGVERVVGYRWVKGLPLVVTVGASLDSALDPIRAEQRWIVAGGGLITLVLLATFGLLFRLIEIRRRKETELAWVNRALAEGEARYRLLAQNATDAIARIGLDLEIRYLSPAIEAITGFEPAELVSRPLVDMVHPDDRARVEEHLRGLIEAGPGAPQAALQYRGLKADGSVGWHEINPTVVFEPRTGEAIEIVDVIRDVSSRRIIEEELRAKSELLETTLESMDQGLIMIDAAGHIVVCNRRAIDLMGFPPELMARRPHFRELRRYQAERGEYVQSGSAFQRWIDEGGPMPDEPLYERVRPNGAVVEVRTVPLPGGGVVRTYTDITARRQAERASRENEERYRLLAENASDIIMLRAVGGPRRYVSPACRAVLGYTPEEFLELPTPELVHPDDLPRVMSIYDRLSPGNPEVRDAHRLRHKDGRWVWVEGAFRLMSGGSEPTVLAALRDVTDRQLQAEQLKTAKDMAEDLARKAQAASEAKSEFLASMSHEIRTPLNSILGFTGLVLDGGSLNPEDRRYIEQVRGSGHALLTVVNDVLDFSKIEAGQVELNPQPFALGELLDNAVSIVRGIALERGIPIALEAATDLPAAVIGDADRLRQILLNLLNNAVKFTRQGWVTLAVRRCAGGLHFTVTDTGIGIPADKLPRLFERFTQVDNSISRQYGGTGLGLAISKRLVTLMGGEIGVESRAGEGSTFWFRVPLAESLTPALPARRPAADGAARPAHILLVEDVAINQELARLILEKAGHRVDVAGDGAEAVEAVRRTAYDLVLMDVQMPVMDGIAATGRIRRLGGAHAALPIVAMTANVLPDQVARFRQAGMDDHVGKPFQAAELLATVARWATSSRLDRAS